MKKVLFIFLVPFLLLSCGEKKPDPTPDPEVVHVESVSISVDPSTQFTVGTDVQLITTILPNNATNKSVTYSSSDMNTAIISKTGLVSCLKAGNVEFTVTSVDGAKTAKLAVSIIQPVLLSSIAITHEPNKTSYYVGDTFIKDGLEVTATYSDTSTKVVTDYSLSTPDMSSVGTKEITVTYQSKTAVFDIVVAAKPEPGVTTDVLTATIIGIDSGHEYKDYSWTAPSNCVYKFNAQYNYGDKVNRAIQMRSKNSNSGIVVSSNATWTAKSISIEWNSLTDTGGYTDPRHLDIYGSNSAYAGPSDLFDTNKQGTLLASLEYDVNDSYTFTSSYKFIGLRSNDGAVYLNYINIVWEK